MKIKILNMIKLFLCLICFLILEFLFLDLFMVFDEIINNIIGKNFIIGLKNYNCKYFVKNNIYLNY